MRKGHAAAEFTKATVQRYRLELKGRGLARISHTGYLEVDFG